MMPEQIKEALDRRILEHRVDQPCRAWNLDRAKNSNRVRPQFDPLARMRVPIVHQRSSYLRCV